MGGPMYWSRLMGRNGFAQLGPVPYSDGYIKDERPRDPSADLRIGKGYIAGELWRMRHDYFARAAALAKVCEITEEQALRVLRAIFTEPEPDCAECQQKLARWDSYWKSVHETGPTWLPGRCPRHEFI